MILFLNKRDVFKEKIEQHPLADWFPEFATVGSNTFDAAAGWIKEQVRTHTIAWCFHSCTAASRALRICSPSSFFLRDLCACAHSCSDLPACLCLLPCVVR